MNNYPSELKKKSVKMQSINDILRERYVVSKSTRFSYSICNLNKLMHFRRYFDKPNLLSMSKHLIKICQYPIGLQ